MAIVEVDSKGRILIPREIRKRFGIKKGMKAYLLPSYADKKIELTFGELEPLEETTRILKNIKWKEEEHIASKLALKLTKKFKIHKRKFYKLYFKINTVEFVFR